MDTKEKAMNYLRLLATLPFLNSLPAESAAATDLEPQPLFDADMLKKLREKCVANFSAQGIKTAQELRHFAELLDFVKEFDIPYKNKGSHERHNTSD